MKRARPSTVRTIVGGLVANARGRSSISIVERLHSGVYAIRASREYGEEGTAGEICSTRVYGGRMMLRVLSSNQPSLVVVLHQGSSNMESGLDGRIVCKHIPGLRGQLIIMIA